MTQPLKLAPLLLITILAAPAAAQSRATTQSATQSGAPTQETPADSHSAAAKFLLYGNTPGSPSTGKLVTVFTLHAITLAALGTGAFLLIKRDHVI